MEANNIREPLGRIQYDKQEKNVTFEGDFKDFDQIRALEIGKFEIPLFLGLGGAIERHNSNFYFGMIIKPEIGLFYRINPDWSIGATAGASIMPQWYKNPEYNYTGYILDAGVSVRYHL